MALFLLISLFLPSLVSAFSWNFTSIPGQCQDLSIKVVGGQPPYGLLIIPTGSPAGTPSPLIFSHYFRDEETSFRMTYPAGREFVAVMSDAQGFGTGGASSRLTVQPHPTGDDSCTRASMGFTGEDIWYFQASPVPPAQCERMAFWWNPEMAQGPVRFRGVIIGGQAFSIDSSLNMTNSSGTYFNWSTPVAIKTSLILLAGDERGEGSAGSVEYVVGGFLKNESDPCIEYRSPNATTPKVGIVSETPKRTCNPRSTSIAPIIGIIGAAAAIILALIALFCYIYRAHRRRCSEHTHPLHEQHPISEPLPTANSLDPSWLGSAAITPMSGEMHFDPYPTWAVETPSPGQSTGVSTRRGKDSGTNVNEPVSVHRYSEAGSSSNPAESDLPPAYT